MRGVTCVRWRIGASKETFSFTSSVYCSSTGVRVVRSCACGCMYHVLLLELCSVALPVPCAA
eukprot:4634593-Prymnesium_polylepis.1